MKLPEPISRTFTGLISDIEKGQIKIPQFQRDFVWDIKKSSKLMDSIIKGYPIGTFIFWKTKERLRSVRNLGNFKLPEPNEGDFIDYVLDGQQRLTSLFATLKGLKIERDEEWIEHYDEMYINLEASEDEEIVIIDKESYPTGQLIRLTDLLYGSLELLFSLDKKYHSKLQDYKTRIEAYNYSIILIRDAPLEIATEIFTRINEGGKPLTVFEIMVAKTFDAEKNFDLSEKFEKLIDDLTEVGYDTISDAIVLQTIALLLDKECKRQTILKLNKKKFIEIWDDVIDAIEKTVDYFRGFYRIPVSQLLPYNALIVPFAYFFYHHRDKPTGDTQKYLQDFFWRVSLGTRYSSAVESKLAQDIKRIDTILKGELPRYDWTIDVSPEIFDKTGFFSTGSSWIKSILCIYAYHQPKSFNDCSIVHISNDWLKQANSKNYHHFFPRAYLDKKLKDVEHKTFWINHILNITIVDDFLNKREIRAKAPSVYMKKFSRHNKEIEETMKSHLIYDIEKYGIWEDDYDRFLKQRAKAVSREIRKRIIEQETDMTIKAELVEDLDQVIEMERLTNDDDDAEEAAPATKTRKELHPTMAGLLDQLLQQGGTWDSIVEQAQAEATKLGFTSKVTKGLITSHLKFRKEKQHKDWAANLKVTEHGIQSLRDKKVTSTQEKVAFFAPLIESGKYTADELVEMSISKFPKVTESTIRTFLTDSKNPKYNKFGRLVVKTEDGKLTFQAV